MSMLHEMSKGLLDAARIIDGDGWPWLFGRGQHNGVAGVD